MISINCKSVSASDKAAKTAAGKLDLLQNPRCREPDRADAMAVACVHVRSWQAAYRTLLPDDYLDQLRPEDRAQKYDFADLDPLKLKLKPQTIVYVRYPDDSNIYVRSERAGQRVMERITRFITRVRTGTHGGVARVGG